ncbi:MAG: glutathione S-transferase family protein [Rhizomicrobium sp.]
MPNAIGSGQPDTEFLKANPRGEVPALIDGETRIFDSTIILEYIEDKWPTPGPLAQIAGRAGGGTHHRGCDGHAFRADHRGMGEIRWFKAAEGERGADHRGRAAMQARGIYAWLERHLADKPWFNGETFGWADLSVVPYVNGALGSGFAPDRGSKLSAWLERANGRPSVQKASKRGGT